LDSVKYIEYVYIYPIDWRSQGVSAGEGQVSFQAHLDNIKARTDKTPEDFCKAARAAGLLPQATATQIVTWLARDFGLGLGRGHAMAIFAVFKHKGWVAPAGKARKR
jgi:hypothetical protein